MARPDYIARLHEAKYDLRYSSGSEKHEKQLAYLAALQEASVKSGIPPYLLEAAVAPDFGVWIRQEKLPKLPPPESDPGTR